MAAPIVIAVGLDTGDAQRSAQQLATAIRSALDGIVPQAGAAGRSAGDAFSRGLTSSLQSVQQAFSNVGQQLSLKVSLPLAGLGATALKAAADIDKSRQTLAALTGSVDAANKKLEEFRRIAQETPGVTTRFATTLFSQFKALGTVTDQSINNIIKSIGRLNAVFTIPDVEGFARNIQQIFTQGFERSDVKEALGQVPIFEQLLEQAFGTKDANKLRQLKESGKLTMAAYVDGLATAIATDPRFANVQESIAGRFAKTKDQILTALAPLGESLLRTLQPVLDRLIPKLIELLDKFAALPPGVQETIVVFGLFAAAFGPVLTGLSSMLSLLTSVIALLTGPASLTIALTSLNPVILGIGGILAAGAIGWYQYRTAVQSATDQIDLSLRKVQESQGIFTGLDGQPVTRRGGRFIDAQSVIAGQRESAQRGGALSTRGVNLLTGLPTTPTPASGTGARPEAAKAEASKQITLLQQYQSRLAELNRELAIFDRASSKEFQILVQIDEAEKKRKVLQDLVDLRRELSLPVGADFTNAKQQLEDLQRLQAGIREARNLPAFDPTKTPQEQVVELVDPRVQAARDRINREREIQIAQSVELVNIRRQQLEIENQLDLGALTQAEARQQINALLRQERDIRIAMLEAEQAMSEITPQRRAEIELEIASIRNLGVELTAAQRFMRGFNSEVESTGDAFDRLGQNLSRSFGNVKGLLDNLKQSFVTFFRDLLGLGLQRVFGQLFGSITGAIGGAGRGVAGVSGGGAGGGIGGIISGGLGSIFGGGGGGGGFLTPGFGGGFPIIGGGFGGAASPIGIAGGLPIANTAGIGAAGAAGIFGRSATVGAFAGLSGLFRGFGFGRAAGSGGALAGIAPLLGLQLGAGLGGQSKLGQILGGVGGAALGIGITAAPAALAAGGALSGLGFLAPLFSNPITAVVGGALLAGSFLLGRSRQRRSDEEQSGVWLQDAINQISQLRDQTRSGSVTLEQARQIFETQILATFVSQIQTLKTKSVRESRLTNQVRDLRNLFESTVVPAAKTGARVNDIQSRLVPEFATGGIVPGTDRGYDSVMAMVRPGEMVLTRNQQSAIQSIAGPGIFRAVGVPQGPGISAGLPAFALGGIMPAFTPTRTAPQESAPIELVVNLVVGKDDASRIVASAQNTSVGQRAVLATLKRARLNREL